MAKKKAVSSKTHTQQQLNDYANQNNPNNNAYKARKSNDMKIKTTIRKQNSKRHAELEKECGAMYPLDWMCYGNPFDFD